MVDLFIFSTHLLGLVLVIFNFFYWYLYAYIQYLHMYLICDKKCQKRTRFRERERESDGEKTRIAAELLFLLNTYMFEHMLRHTLAQHTRTEFFFSPLFFNCTLLKVIKSVCAHTTRNTPMPFCKSDSYFFSLVEPCSCFFGSWFKSLNWKCTNCRKYVHYISAACVCVVHCVHAHYMFV